MNEQIKKNEDLLNFIGHLGLQKNNPCMVCEFRKDHLSWRCSKCEEFIKYLTSLLEAQARVERARAVEIIEKHQQRAQEDYGKISIAPLDIYMMMQSEVDGAKQEILSDNN